MMDAMANHRSESGFVVRSARGDAMLAFQPASDDDGSFRADVRTGTGLAASATVSLTQAGLAEFFAAMAREWRGWAGKREFTALPPGTGYSPPALRLIVAADGPGHTQLRVELGTPWLGGRDPEDFDTHVGFGPPEQDGAWSAETLLILEAGQLDELAAAAALLGS
jgi:hypothetical protein